MSRQTAKAAEEAKATTTLTSTRSKRSDRQPQRARTEPLGGRGGDQNESYIDQPLTGMPSSGKKKKKKRSALANASNPHHLRNYVPSRLPHAGSNTAQATQNAHNALGPLPLRFLGAQIASTRKSNISNENSAPEDADVINEWICPFCEYNLFYGDEQAFRRALRGRKKILRRRRRARERAAAAAAGKAAPAATSSHVAEEDEEALFEAPHDDVPAAITAQMKWKGERNRTDDDRRANNPARGSGGSV